MYKNVKQVFSLLSFQEKKIICSIFLLIYSYFFRIDEYWNCFANCNVYL